MDVVSSTDPKPRSLGRELDQSSDQPPSQQAETLSQWPEHRVSETHDGRTGKEGGDYQNRNAEEKSVLDQ